MSLLHVQDLTAGYADLTILRDISFDLEPGEILCITGRNGVGKTTLMRALTGTIPLMGGVVRLDQTDLTALPTNQRQRLGLSYGPQDGVTFAPLSVRENLTLHLPNQSLDRYASFFAAFPRIEERLDQKAGSLSGGERKILSFCRAVAEGGKLLALDEPTEGVQPENIARMASALLECAANRIGMLVVEQNLSLVEQIADRVIVIDHGDIVARLSKGPTLRKDVEAHLRV